VRINISAASSRVASRACFEHDLSSTVIYLSLGSNLGDRSAILRTAIEALAGQNVRVRKISSFYETEPVDYAEQPWFLNCVVETETNLAPLDLLRVLRGIEAQLGSKKEFTKGPRLLDMDILLYGDKTIDLPELQIPHPRMLQRNFVLAPLAEIAPSLKHPTWSSTAARLFSASPDKSTIRKL
jgi:2-amino-4-hydroxy-6-hydroxymethyldihydropteridine diphosphokinase